MRDGSMLDPLQADNACRNTATPSALNAQERCSHGSVQAEVRQLWRRTMYPLTPRSSGKGAKKLTSLNYFMLATGKQ